MQLILHIIDKKFHTVNRDSLLTELARFPCNQPLTKKHQVK